MTNSTSAGPTNDDVHLFYGYVPSLPAAVVFTVFFFISTVAHLGQAIRYKMWYLILTAVVAGTLEFMGWVARTYSHFHPGELTPYLVQTVATINAPTYLVVVYFIILAEIIRRLGPCYSRFSPRMNAGLFLAANFIALTLQIAGSAVATVAANKNKSPHIGNRVMLGGIIFQMITITVYMFLALEFICRYVSDKPFERLVNQPPTGSYFLDKNMKAMIFVCAFSSLALYVRSVYRSMELTNGWSGRITTTERYFNAMEGTMILLMMCCLNIFHPGRLLGPSTSLQGVMFSDEDLLVKKRGHAT